MGKVLSTQSRVSHQDASKCMQREKSSCHRSTSKRHIARRARGMSEWIVRRYNKRASMANERLFASFHDYKRRNVGKRTGSHSKRYKRGGPWFEKPNINHIPYYATLNEECDLDESLVEFVKRSGLSMAFFLTTDQNQGCSHWDEETLYAEYAHIRQSRKKKKEEALAMAQQQLYMVPTHEKESYMSLEGVDIDIPMAEFYADTSDINEGSDNNQEDTLYNEVHPSVVDHYSTSAKEAMQELIKDSTSPSLATIGLEGLGEVKSECAAIIAPNSPTNCSSGCFAEHSECPAECPLVSVSIAESEAQLMANIVDQDKDCTMRDADEGEALSHHSMDEQQTIDGLYSHLKFFSPKSLVNGSPTLAKNEDHVEYPMIEIVTEEKLESVVASIMINETVAQQHAENDLGPNNIRVLADTMNMLYSSFLSLDLRWSYYCIDINKDVRHKMLHSQIVLKKQETPSQVSLHEAKLIGLC